LRLSREGGDGVGEGPWDGNTECSLFSCSTIGSVVCQNTTPNQKKKKKTKGEYIKGASWMGILDKFFRGVSGRDEGGSGQGQ